MCFEMKWVCSFRELLSLNRLAGKTTRRWHTRVFRGMMLLVSIAGLAVTMLLVVNDAFTGKNVLLVVMSVLLLLLGVCYHHINAWMSRRMMVRGSDYMEYRFGEDGIRVTSATAISEHPYSAVWAIYRFQGRIFLFIDKKHGYIVPEQGFSMGSAQAFVPFIEAKCGMEVKTIR